MGNSRHYSYDAAGDLVRYTDRNGAVRAFEYDDNHYVIGETWYESSGEWLVASGENDSSLATSHQPLATITYEYDKAGRLISESDNCSSITYVYDDLGRGTSATQSSIGGPSVTLANTFDGASDRRSSVTASIDGVVDFVNDYTYNKSGLATSVFQHGISGGNAVADKQVDFGYTGMKEKRCQN